MFLQILHTVNKFQLCCSVFSISTCSKLASSVEEVVSSFVYTFSVSFLHLRLFKTSSNCLPDVFDPVKWKKLGFCFATTFQCCLLAPNSVLCSVSYRLSFRPQYRHYQSHCLHLNVFQVGRFLLPLSFLKYFQHRLK